MIRFAHVPMPEAFEGLSLVARATWMSLCSFAKWRDGMFFDCFPSKRAIAERAGLKKTSVFLALKELERAGMIQRDLRVYLTTVYKPGPAIQDVNGGVQDMNGGGQDVNGGGQDVNGGVRNMNPNITNNTINKHDQGTEDPAAANPLLSQVIQLWNDLLTPLGFPEVLRATSARRRAFGARLAEAPERRDLAWWEALIGRVASTPFLAQSAAEGAKWLTLDWLLKEQNLTKLSEGRYDGSNRRAVPKSGLEEYLRELAKDPFFGGDDA